MEVLPAVLRLLDGEIGVQVAVRLLGLLYDVDDAVRPGFQIRIRLHGQGIGHALQPFRQVAVLEHHPVELPFAQAGGDAEVLDGMALGHPGNFIVQYLLLKGNDYIDDFLLHPRPESVRHLYLADIYLSCCFFHICPPSCRSATFLSHPGNPTPAAVRFCTPRFPAAVGIHLPCVQI